MKTIGVLFLMLFFINWYMQIYKIGEYSGRIDAFDNSVAHNFITYRHAVIKYDFHAKGESDEEINIADLREYLPPDYEMHANHDWHARISDGFVFVWGEADAKHIALTRKLMKYSYSIGENQNGTLQPIGMALPNFIPENSLVSRTGSNRYKTDNEY